MIHGGQPLAPFSAHSPWAPRPLYPFCVSSLLHPLSSPSYDSFGSDLLDDPFTTVLLPTFHHFSMIFTLRDCTSFYLRFWFLHGILSVWNFQTQKGPAYTCISVILVFNVLVDKIPCTHIYIIKYLLILKTCPSSLCNNIIWNKLKYDLRGQYDISSTLP